MARLEGKVALITGAARGQGRSHALAMAREGAEIVAVDICDEIGSVPYGLATPDDLKETVEQVEALDRRIIGRKVDARDQAQLDGVVAEAISEFGGIDIVAINHGIWTRGPLWELSEQTWQDTVDTNLTAVWKTLKAVAPHLIDRRRGSIVITSSVNGVEAQAGSAHYTASKHGAIGLMKSAAMEFAPHGVRVNAIMPGFVDTNMTNWQGAWDMTSGHPGGTREEHEVAARHWHAFGGLMRPEDISGAVVFLASDESSRITGIEMPVDSGHLVLSTFNPAPPD
ncbi:MULTISPECIES: mycofactocin-coupled SDR family oxidoreductase [unclassified Pseudonocardia]|uniref:mycofactocin-coupled SDR family oxidoreductase n=1 Tax=unclassified Pseudonocardia TaxID=2619320 RepID=UPI0001FFE6AE|nr:mycofactocin-coupled SDR family oxidoreductase [Pseudonocardia sp. Ae707_Ps1]OLM08936.1 carveol dehydrogenase [Pseudonocardia sp. Ae707_Ps1]